LWLETKKIHQIEESSQQQDPEHDQPLQQVQQQQ
jgi:hypothetical protein